MLPMAGRVRPAQNGRHNDQLSVVRGDSMNIASAHRAAFASLLVFAVSSAPVLAAATPEGPSFVIPSSRPFSYPYYAPAGSVAVLPGGEFVVATELSVATAIGPTQSIVAIRYQADGTRIGEPIQLGESSAQSPAIALDPTGGVIVAWGNTTPTIYARRLAADGALKDPAPILVNTGVAAATGVEVAVRSDGAFAVVWLAPGPAAEITDEAAHVFGRGFSPAGLPYGPAFRLGARPASQRCPGVIFAPDGALVAVWEEFEYRYDAPSAAYPASLGIYLRRMGIAGLKKGPMEQRIDSWPIPGSCPRIGSNASGEFAVGWYHHSLGLFEHHDVFGHRFNSAGLVLESFEFNIASSATRSLSSDSPVAVAMDAAGGTVFVWAGGESADPYEQHALALRYDPAGVRRDATPFVVDDVPSSPPHGNNSATHARIASRPGGGFVAVWSDGRNGSYTLRGRLFKGP
jgi:hypothetical protein